MKVLRKLKKVKIGGHILLINIANKGFEKHLQEKDGLKAGKSWLGGEVIIVNRALSKEQQEETLLHEIIHHILFRMGRNQECEDEQLVQGLASWLHAVLKDNNLLK